MPPSGGIRVSGHVQSGPVGGARALRGALLHAYPLLQMMGWIHLGLEALNQARVAKQRIAAEGETPHRKGKVLNLTFFVANVLPQAVALGKRIQSGDATALDPALFA